MTEEPEFAACMNKEKEQEELQRLADGGKTKEYNYRNQVEHSIAGLREKLEMESRVKQSHNIQLANEKSILSR